MLAFLRRLLVLSFVFVAASAAAQRQPAGVSTVTSVEGIDEYRLANGLQVLLVPDDSKPTTTVNLTYRVGSRHENYGETGMAHLLEHMLFKGTPRHPKVWAEFEKRGLAANGSTAWDRTNYTASFSSNEDNLNWYLGWLADAMVNSFIARKDLDTEMTVVRNEMEMGENSPDAILFQRTVATMFEWHNYGKNIIGARADVENVDIPRLQAFYRQYYQPDNATLIVSGRFETARLLKQIASTFGAIRKPARKLPPTYTLDPAQDGERGVTLRRSGGVPMLMAAYHVPAGAHPDFAAVEVLTQVFGDTPSGRLHKRLVETRLAASAYAFSLGLAEPGFVALGAQLAPAQDLDKARTALLEAIEAVAREPVSQEELDRAKARWLKGWEQAFTNPEAIGLSLSESIAQGDWRMFFLTRDRVRDITLADVQRVAAQYLVPSNRTLGTYVPTDKPQRAPAPAFVDLVASLKGFKPAAAAGRVESFEATPANIDARTQALQIGGLKVALLAKGTRGGAVHAVLRLHFGDEKSLAGQGAVSEAVAALLDKGTPSLTRQAVQDRLDQIKTEMAIGGRGGVLSVSLNTRREHLPAAIALVGELLRNATFPAEALDEYKRQGLASVEQARREPAAIAENALARHGNPYPRGDLRHARSFDEIAEDIAGLQREQLVGFHQRFYGAGRAEFGAVGDLDVAAVKSALEAAFSGWRGGEPYARVPNPLVPVPAQRLVFETPDKQNATLLYGARVPLSDLDPDYAALTMANHLLGGGGNSRLWRRIREVEGLSYDVRSSLAWNNQEPHTEWTGSAIFAPQNRAKVEAAFAEEVARALKEGFTAAELAEGQRGLLNFRRLSRAQDANLANALASNLDLGRTFAVSARVDAALAALTLEQVNTALRKYVKPDAWVRVLAGDFK